jgi:hypothetical protein
MRGDVKDFLLVVFVVLGIDMLRRCFQPPTNMNLAKLTAEGVLAGAIIGYLGAKSWGDALLWIARLGLVPLLVASVGRVFSSSEEEGSPESDSESGPVSSRSDRPGDDVI